MRVIEVPSGAAGMRALWGPLDEALAGGPPIAVLPEVSAAAPGAMVDAMRAAISPSEPVDATTAVVISTSGSTGRPRGVLLSAAALTSLTSQVNSLAGFDPAWILALPPTSIGGLNVLVRARATGLAPTPVESIGGAGRFSDDAFHAAVEAASAHDRPLAVSLVPAQLPRLLATGKGRAALARCSLILVGGAALAPNAVRDCTEAGIEVTTTYGMTETSGGCVLNGVPLPQVQVRLDEADDRVWLAGPMLASGYRDGRNLAFVDGWLRTHDRGRWIDGRLTILGRLDDIVTVNGVNVDLLAVEDRLREHPMIADSIAVAIADREHDAAVHAICIGNGAVEDVRAWVADALGKDAAPSHVHWLDSFASTVSGKVDRLATARSIGLDPVPVGDLDGDLL